MMRLAYLAATRATCLRKHVGAVITSYDHRVVATGYNGAPADVPSCDEVGCQLVEGHCVRTLHAESNAVDYAGRFAQGCTVYTTVTPCWDCAKRIVGVGIIKVVYDEHYESRYGKSMDVPDYLRANKVAVVKFDPERMSKFRALLQVLDASVDAAPKPSSATSVAPESCAIHRFAGDGLCVICGISDPSLHS